VATTLERIIEERGPWMIRRMAQAFLMVDRGISARRLAQVLEVSNTTITNYLRGTAPARRATVWDHEETEAEFEQRREAFEDEVEKALEFLVWNQEQEGVRSTPPRAAVVIGAPDHTGIPDVVFPAAYIPEVMTKELMKQP
jgi:predicted transcriptional regulator